MEKFQETVFENAPVKEKQKTSNGTGVSEKEEKSSKGQTGTLQKIC